MTGAPKQKFWKYWCALRSESASDRGYTRVRVRVRTGHEANTGSAELQWSVWVPQGSNSGGHLHSSGSPQSWLNALPLMSSCFRIAVVPL
eukprot:scaffold23620_cov88-Phaeocystis_antarctica.AAC.1